MKKRTLKKLIGLSLSMVMLVILCSNTVMVLDEQNETIAEVSSTSEDITDGIYCLKNPETGKYVDVDDGASTFSGAILEQWDYDDAYTQKWFFSKVTSGTYAGYYTIMNMKSRLYMTVENNSSENSANLILSEFSGTSGQY